MIFRPHQIKAAYKPTLSSALDGVSETLRFDLEYSSPQNLITLQIPSRLQTFVLNFISWRFKSITFRNPNDDRTLGMNLGCSWIPPNHHFQSYNVPPLYTKNVSSTLPVCVITVLYSVYSALKKYKNISSLSCRDFDFFYCINTGD